MLAGLEELVVARRRHHAEREAGPGEVEDTDLVPLLRELVLTPVVARARSA